MRGWLKIFDIQKDKTLQNIQALTDNICSVAFTQDNQSAFISDWEGKIKMIKWKPNANTEQDFDFTQNSTKVGNEFTLQICLTRDDKNLLVGTKGFVRVFNTETRKVTKVFKLVYHAIGIKLIGYGKNALIADYNGDLTIINLETMEISSSHQNAINGKKVRAII